MRILRQVAIIFAICLFCEGISALLPFPFPGSVLSMIVLLLLFFTKRLKLSDVKETSDLLLGNMMLVFVPSFVSVIDYLDVLKSVAVQFLVIIVVSTVLTFLTGSFVVSLLFRLQSRAGRQREGGEGDA